MTRNLLGESQLAAWKALLNAHASAIAAIESRLSAANQISLSWYDVLWTLRKQPGRQRLRFRALQEEIVLSRSALSRLVDSLASAGLVRKAPCPDDARGIDVELTENGEQALSEAWPVYEAGIEEHFARHLTVAECEQLGRLLGKLAR